MRKGFSLREKPFFIAIHTCKHTAMNESTVGAGAYTGPRAEVVFGPYKGGTFIATMPRRGCFLVSL